MAHIIDTMDDDELEPAIDTRVYREQLVHFALFVGLLAGLFLILTLFALAGKKSWQNGLRRPVAAAVQTVDSSYTVGDFEPINSSFATSAACFCIETEQGEKTDMHAVVMRVTTLYGPLPAVFLYDGQKEQAEFIQFLATSRRMEQAATEAARHSQIAYWELRIPLIIGR